METKIVALLIQTTTLNLVQFMLFLRKLCVVVLLLAYLVSCQEAKFETNQGSTPNPNSKLINIAEAQHWVNANWASVNYYSGRKGENKIEKKILWEKAKSYGVSLIVPLLYETKYSLKNQGYRVLVFERNEKSEIQGHILEVIADKEYLKKGSNKFNQEFTGFLIQYGWGENFLSGVRLENGKLAGKVIASYSNPSKIEKSQNNAGRTQTCGYQYSYVAYENGQYVPTVIWVSQPCTTSGGFGAYSNTEANLQRQYEASYDYYEFLLLLDEYWYYRNRDIVNNLRTPCLSLVASRLINANLKAKVNKILTEVFGVSDEVNVELYENANLPAHIEGQTLPQISYYADPGQPGNTPVVNISIELNPNVLANSTQEYISAVILHEIVHGYLFSNSRSNTFSIGDHTLMASSYVGELKEAILEIYPNYPPHYAEAISWGGLQDTPTWNVYKQLPGWEQAIKNINSAEKGVAGAGAPVGTRCP